MLLFSNLYNYNFLNAFITNSNRTITEFVPLLFDEVLQQEIGNSTEIYFYGDALSDSDGYRIMKDIGLKYYVNYEKNRSYFKDIKTRINVIL